MRKIILELLVLAILMCSIAANASEVKIAFRYDADRIVFVVNTRGPMYRQANGEQNLLELAAPVAKLSGLNLRQSSRLDHPDSAEMLNGLQIGEEFSLLLGQQRTVTVSVSQTISTNIYCSGAAVAIADIAEKDRKLFRATSEKYYLISPEDPGEPSVAHLGLDWSKLPSDKTNRLQQTLQTMLKNELPGIIENSEPYHKRLLKVGYTWPLRWQLLDRQLQAGDTTLLFDAQQVWLKQAEPIYFVRARWVIKGAMVFGISSWIDGQMQIKQVDTTVAKRLRSMPGRNIQNPDYGLILNLFDQDRDGNGEVLFYQSGYEGASFTLLEYDGDKFIPTGVALNIGC